MRRLHFVVFVFVVVLVLVLVLCEVRRDGGTLERHLMKFFH